MPKKYILRHYFMAQTRKRKKVKKAKTLYYKDLRYITKTNGTSPPKG